MATRSLIALDNTGVFTSIYCHWDGYLTGVGRILLENYTDINDVEELLDLGDLSTLGYHPTECKPFAKETNDFAKDFSSLQNLIIYFHNSDCEYLYIFNGLGWEYMTKKMLHTILLVPSDVKPPKQAKLQDNSLNSH